ncbi:MAG: GNAT family N-acetyltransferase [SAR324 cluster bacterium]|nr:GNAT family N-acetyltransferase [SAR324 cluster bacterium]
MSSLNSYDMGKNKLPKTADSKLFKAEESTLIRDAVQDDLTEIIKLDAQNTGIEKNDYWQAAFDRFGNGESGFFLVAETEQNFCGYILGEVRAWEFGSPPCGWVFALGVHNDAREMGVGSKLFDSICQHFKNTGIEKVRTMLARSDHLNMSFFRSRGMRGGPFIQLEKNVAD